MLKNRGKDSPGGEYHIIVNSHYFSEKIEQVLKSGIKALPVKNKNGFLQATIPITAMKKDDTRYPTVRLYPKESGDHTIKIRFSLKRERDASSALKGLGLNVNYPYRSGFTGPDGYYTEPYKVFVEAKPKK